MNRSTILSQIGCILRITARPYLAVTLLLSLISPANAAEPDDGKIHVDVPIFEGGQGMASFKNIADEYNRINKLNVHVDIYGDPRIADNIRIRCLEGSFPESTSAGLEWWPLIKSGEIEPLDKYLDGPNWEGDDKWRNTFAPGSLETYTYEGKVYGCPHAFFPNVIWYNPTIFEAHGWTAPKTWNEFFALCEKMKAVNIVPLSFQGRYSYYAEPIFASAYYSVAGFDAYKNFRKLTPGSFDNPACVEALRVTQRFGSYFMEGSMGNSHTEAQLEFLSSKTAMLPCGAWFKSEMLGKIPDGFRLRAFNLPIVDNGVGDPKAINAFAADFFVFAHSKHPAEAIDFLRFLTSRDMATRFAKERDIPVAIKGTKNSDLSPDVADVVKMIEGATLNYGNAGEDVFVLFPAMKAESWDGTFEDVLKGTLDPAVAAKKLEADAKRIRAKSEDPNYVNYTHIWQPITLILLVILSIFYLLIFRKRAEPDRGTSAAGGGRLGTFDFIKFVLPATLIFLLFVIVPSIRAFSWSLQSWSGFGGIGTMEWSGLLHFKRLLFESDPFWIALQNNLFLMFVIPAFVIPIALLLAACLSRGIIGAKVFRVVFFFPSILGTVAVALLWTQLYTPNGGLINAALTGIGLKFFTNFAWLSNDHLYWSLIPMSVWGGCGFNMVLYLAAMQSIPEDLYEAAEIEGASQWSQFWTITIPMIWDILIVSIVFLIIAGMKAFDIIWLLTNQRPEAKTNVIGTRVVQTMFNEFNIGEATAMAVILFILVFLGSATTMRLLKRETVEV